MAWSTTTTTSSITITIAITITTYRILITNLSFQQPGPRCLPFTCFRVARLRPGVQDLPFTQFNYGHVNENMVVEHDHHGI
jgi:hypothetical protein